MLDLEVGVFYPDVRGMLDLDGEGVGSVKFRF